MHRDSRRQPIGLPVDRPRLKNKDERTRGAATPGDERDEGQSPSDEPHASLASQPPLHARTRATFRTAPHNVSRLNQPRMSDLEGNGVFSGCVERGSRGPPARPSARLVVPPRGTFDTD